MNNDFMGRIVTCSYTLLVEARVLNKLSNDLSTSGA